MTSSYMLPAGETTDSLSMRRRMAMALAQKNMQPLQVDHWTQGLAHVVDQARNGYEMAQIDREEKDETAKANALMASLFNGGQPSSPATVSAPASAGGFGDAIAGIESGGKYDALGPQTRTGDRAYGKYQVMGANVPEWTKAHLGRSMTPDEFLADPKAQDAVFQGQFGQYAQRHGPEGAARAWFAGEGGMNDLGRKDQLGTSVGQYGQKFAQALQTQPEQTAPAGPNREAVIQMLGNRKTAPFAQKIISDQIGQQFKPQDYDIQQRPDGTVIAVGKKNPNDVKVINAPGAGQSAIDFEAKKAAAVAKAKGEAEKLVGQEQRTKEERQVANVVVQDIDRAIKTMDTASLPTTGATGALLSNVGGTAARDVKGLVDTVKANAGFAELQKMRNNSPTGGALGQVSEREIAYLQATIGNLEQSQSAGQLKDNMRRVKNTYLDIIHGEGKGPPREKLGFEQKGAKGGLQPGAVEQGYRFKGGDPSKRENWEQVM
jgi:hypothetical protein